MDRAAIGEHDWIVTLSGRTVSFQRVFFGKLYVSNIFFHNTHLSVYQLNCFFRGSGLTLEIKTTR